MGDLRLLVSFVVWGLPQPAGSKRAFKHSKTQKIIVMDANPKNKAWQSIVRDKAKENFCSDPVVSPVLMLVKFFMPRPKTHYRRYGIRLRENAPVFCLKRPDTTKLIRSVEDALTNVIWRDDSQVVYQIAAKAYGEAPHTEISVYEIDESNGIWDLLLI